MEDILRLEFLRRIDAAIVDIIILLFSCIIIIKILPFKISIEINQVILFIILSWLYFATLESSTLKGTIGKMSIGLIVSDVKGNKLSFIKATLRHISKIASLSIVIYFISYATNYVIQSPLHWVLYVIGFDYSTSWKIDRLINIVMLYIILLFLILLPALNKKNQALHDIIAGTLVINKTEGINEG